jgi:AcrR family transcriptional regulator
VPAAKWLRAVDEFDEHINNQDWSGQTPGRSRILEVFLRLAIENGFNSVSMRMIARALSIKAPSLYAHFEGGRDEIVAESLRWHFYKFGCSVLDGIRGVTDPGEGWQRMVDIHVRQQLELPESNLWDLLVATDQMVGFLPADLREEVDTWIDRYEALYRAAAHDMGFGHSRRSVQLVMTVLEGANRWTEWDGKPQTLAAGVEVAQKASLALLSLEDSPARLHTVQASVR